MFGAGIYGGYFGAAQGIILLALTSIALPDDLQRLNALKNVLAGLVNAVAAVIFVFFAPRGVAAGAPARRRVGRAAASSARGSAGGSRRPCCAA